MVFVIVLVIGCGSTFDWRLQDLALFWIPGAQGEHCAVHAICVCNDRMGGVKEYHEIDNAAETTVIRNTVETQRIPWPKLSAEQERWDSLSVADANVCKPDKVADMFPIHAVGPDKKRRVFVMSTLFMR